MGSHAVSPDRYDMRYTKNVSATNGLSSTVIIEDTHYVNVTFRKSLVDRAGMVLPHGCSIFNPTFMTMGFDIKSGVYRIYVQYLKKPHLGKYQILATKERPKWLRYMRPLPGKTENTVERKEQHDTHHQAEPA